MKKPSVGWTAHKHHPGRRLKSTAVLLGNFNHPSYVNLPSLSLNQDPIALPTCHMLACSHRHEQA